MRTEPPPSSGNDRDAAVERWLREAVAASYDAMKADPSRGIDAKTVFAEIRARHALRSKSGLV
jgi:antitoxin ParD1/3/4